MNQDRAVYWGLVGKELSEIEAIYGYIREQPHLAAYLVSHGEVQLARGQWSPLPHNRAQFAFLTRETLLSR